MRNVDEGTRDLLKRVLSFAHALAFPEMTIDFRGDRYMTSWGPGMDPWIDVLFACELEDLFKIERSLSARATDDADAVQRKECTYCHRKTTDIVWHTWAQHGSDRPLAAPDVLSLGSDHLVGRGIELPTRR